MHLQGLFNRLNVKNHTLYFDFANVWNYTEYKKGIIVISEKCNFTSLSKKSNVLRKELYTVLKVNTYAYILHTQKYVEVLEINCPV